MNISKNILSKFIVPKIKKIPAIPKAYPKSPILFTINAFKAALFADLYDAKIQLINKMLSPTPSQPKNICNKLLLDKEYQHKKSK